MKTHHVGGWRPIGKQKTLGDALRVAGHDDIIELHKKTDIQNVIKRPVTIDAHGKELIVPPGKKGIVAEQPVIIKNAKLRVPSRSNGIIFERGAVLDNVQVVMDGPIHDFYPVIQHKSGELLISNSDIQKLITSDMSIVEITDSKLRDYYGARFDIGDNSNMNILKGKVSILGCEISSTVFAGNIGVQDSVVGAYNKNVSGSDLYIAHTAFTHIDLQNKVNIKKEPEHGPLRTRRDVPPYLLMNLGKIRLQDYTSYDTNEHFILLSQGGFIDVNYTSNPDSEGLHYIQNTSLGFSDTTDSAYYHLQDSVVSKVKSNVELSQQSKSATEKLDELIGLTEVKKTITSVMNTIQMSQKPENKDFEFSYHMVFAGDPGTGKTTVAKIAAQALFEIGAVPENKVTEVTVDKLIKGYVGQTAANVREILDDALGGVLFIDEAYELTVKDNEKSFNSEALSVIIRYMEDHRDDLVVIAAGYTKEMQEFLASNVGLQRRFQWIEFEDYTNEEMAEIFELMRTSNDKAYDNPKLATAIPTLFGKLTNVYLSKPDPNGRITNGGNGGLVRNVYQNVIQQYNNRIMQGEDSNPNLMKPDILGGFQEEMNKAKRT